MSDFENYRKHFTQSTEDNGNRRPLRKIVVTVIAIAVCAALVGLALEHKSGAPVPVVKSAAVAAAVKVDAAKDAPVARLGDVAVSHEEIRQWLAALPPEWRTAVKDKPEVREQWLREHLAEKALTAEARGKHWDQRPEVVSAVQAATEQIVLRSYLDSVSQVPPAYPSDQEVAGAYEQAKGKLLIPTRYHLRQIFLAAPAGDAAAVETVRKQADALVAQARAAGAEFGDLARQYSQDAQSVTKGGDIGMQSLQQLTPEVRTIIATLGTGDVSDPIASTDGFHIIKLDEIVPERTATLEEVKPQLTAALRQQRQRQLAQDYLTHLTTAAPLSIDDSAVNAVITQP